MRILFCVMHTQMHLLTRSHIPLTLTLMQYGGTPLHRAAANGNTRVVALLLATPGVDPLATYVR